MSVPFATPSGGTERPVDPPQTRWRERRADHRDSLLAHMRSGSKAKAPPARQTVGTYTGLCLLIAFADRPPSTDHREVDDFCNRPGYGGFGNNGSVADYFRDASAGRLTYRTIVLPYYTAQHPFAHYDDNTIAWPERTRELVSEALAFHLAAGVDFGALTADAQQAVYAINVFYAGAQAATFSQGLWPHSGRLVAPLKLAPGRVALDYQLCAMGDALTLGVYCHENGHMLCEFPDLYDRATSRRGIGRYCLMCQGCIADSRNPTHPCGYLRWKAGWGEARPLAAGPQTLPPSTTNTFLIHRRSDTEYLLLENRLNRGRDASLPGSGLAIWHVDELGDNFLPENSPVRHAECRLLQADGLTELDDGIDDGDAQDLFAQGRDAVFVEGTPLAPRWWDGSPTGLQIRRLRADGEDLRFEVELA